LQDEYTEEKIAGMLSSSTHEKSDRYGAESTCFWLL
jgi:hypothetical protein